MVLFSASAFLMILSSPLIYSKQQKSMFDHQLSAQISIK